MNWSFLIIAGIILIALVTFLVYRNLKDKTNFENQIKQDYPKPHDEEGDADIEDPMK